jgi:hypothetical protein
MHWRKAHSGSNGRIPYLAIVALFASVALAIALLFLRRHV